MMGPDSDLTALSRDTMSRAHGFGARRGRADDLKNTTPLPL
jgi:hypothetical protein